MPRSLFCAPHLLESRLPQKSSSYIYRYCIPGNHQTGHLDGTAAALAFSRLKQAAKSDLAFQDNRSAQHSGKNTCRKLAILHNSNTLIISLDKNLTETVPSDPYCVPWRKYLRKVSVWRRQAPPCGFSAKWVPTDSRAKKI